MNELKFDKLYGGDCFTPTEKRIAKEVWIECQKETEPLRGEVAMLRDALKLAKHQLNWAALPEIDKALNNTQATALAYERELENRGAVKALEDFRTVLIDALEDQDGSEDEEDNSSYDRALKFSIQEIDVCISELRASNKGEVK